MCSKVLEKEVYSGTFVASGSAYIRADKVGTACLANSLQAKANTFKRSPSEILKSLKRLFLVVGVTVIAMAAFLIITFAVQGKFANDELLLTGVKSITGSLVAMIPSGLYLLTSTALAIGVIGLSNLGLKDTKIKELEDKVKKYESDSVKTKIARTAGLPDEMADRLRGTTEEEMKADAESLAKLVSKKDVAPLGDPEPNRGGGDDGDDKKNAAFRKMLKEMKGQE